MKKSVLVIIIVAVIAAGFFPFTREVAVPVNASYINSYSELFTPDNWKNWRPDLKQAYLKDSSAYKITKTNTQTLLAAGDESYTITQQSSNTLLVEETKNGTKFNYNYYLVSNPLGVTATIIATFKTNLIKYLMPGYEATKVAETSVKDFKIFMETPSLYYGFNITKASIAEKHIIVKKKTITVANIYREGGVLEQQIINYIAQNKLTQVGQVMAQYNQKQGDSLQIMVGIPVKEKAATTKEFIYMHIPATNILTADFKGKYRDKQKIYTAMGHYLEDKFQHPKIAPMEAFTGKFPANTDDTTNFKLIYPIF